MGDQLLVVNYFKKDNLHQSDMTYYRGRNELGGMLSRLLGGEPRDRGLKKEKRKMTGDF